MTFWVLDDGPFGSLAKHYNRVWSWPARFLHTVAEVASAASLDRSGRRNSLLDMQHSGQPVIEVHSIMAGSKAANFLFEYLRPRAASATKNLGEDAAIAYCVTERTDACLVTDDKHAAFLALAELGRGRVATPFDLWDDLLSRSSVRTSSQACAKQCAKSSASLGFHSGSGVDRCS